MTETYMLDSACVSVWQELCRC